MQKRDAVDARLKRALDKIHSELRHNEAEEVVEALESLADSKLPVACFLQEPPVTFHSKFMVQENHVLLIKPEPVAKHIQEGSTIVVEYTDVEGQTRNNYHIALRVLRPEVRINERVRAMVCEIPREFLVSRSKRRLARRYSVAKFNISVVNTKRDGAIYPLYDLSQTGISFEIEPHHESGFPLERIFHNWTLRWPDHGELTVLFLRVKAVRVPQVSCRIGLNHQNLKILNEWLKTLDALVEE